MRFGYGEGKGLKVRKVYGHHMLNCTKVRFDKDGQMLYSSSSDQSIIGVDLETDKMAYKMLKAHEDPISSMHLEDKFIFTGDDEGCVKVRFKGHLHVGWALSIIGIQMWDLRQPKKIREFFENEAMISCIDYNADNSVLAVTSNDCTFNIAEIRMGKIFNIQRNEPLSCCKIIGNNEYLVIGDDIGELSLFSWSQWDSILKNTKYRDSVECLCQIDDKKLIVGYGDGHIQILDILAKNVLADISSGIEMPINALSVSNDGKYLAFVCDQSIKSYNLLNGGWTENLEKGTIDHSTTTTDNDYIHPRAVRRHPSCQLSNPKKIKNGGDGERIQVKEFFSDL